MCYKIIINYYFIFIIIITFYRHQKVSKYCLMSILAISLSKIKKRIKYNKKKEIKTANHDIELIQDLLNEFNPNIKISNKKTYSLIGDKGYKTDKKYIIQKEKISICVKIEFEISLKFYFSTYNTKKSK